MLQKVRPPSPGQVRHLQSLLLGTKPTTAPRRFSRPCTGGHTPVPRHMEMRHLCSYTAASESGPRGCPSGCSPSGPRNEVQEQQHCLPKTFLQQVLFPMLDASALPCSQYPLPRNAQTTNRLHFCSGWPPALWAVACLSILFVDTIAQRTILSLILRADYYSTS